MKTKKVNRYYCDYCKKSGGSAGHMKRHESACTLNPARECRVCKLPHGEYGREEFEQRPVAELVPLLPDTLSIPCEDEPEFYKALSDATNKALPSLRKACGDCPACIMAALRQASIPVWAASDFNYTEEMKQIMADLNRYEP